MKKWWLFMGIVLLVFGCSLWIDGIMFKRQYLELVDMINADNRLNVTVLSYDEGWLSSQVKIRIERVEQKFTSGAKTPSGIYVVIDQTISHGPVIFSRDSLISTGVARIESTVHIPGDLETKIMAGPVDTGIMKINSWVSFDGTWNNHLITPAFNDQKTAVALINWQGLRADVVFQVQNKQINKMNSDVTLGPMTLSLAPNSYLSEMHIEPITSHSQAVRQTMGLWNGTVNISVPSVSIQTPHGTFKMNGFEYATAFGVKNSTYYDADTAVNIKNLLLPNESLHAISNIALSANVTHLSALGLLSVKNFSDTTKVPTHQEVQQYSALIAKLITTTSSLDWVATANTTYGKLRVKGNIYWPKNAALPQNKIEISEKSNFSIHLSVPIQLVNSLIDHYAGNTVVENPVGPAMQQSATLGPMTRADMIRKNLAAEIQRGYILKEGTDYVVNFTRLDGIMKLNGNVYTPEQSVNAVITLLEITMPLGLSHRTIM